MDVEGGKYKDSCQHYCKKCKIIFKTDTVHASHNPTHNSYALLIKEFDYNGKSYKGMPIFENYEEYFENHKKFKMSWVCMCPGRDIDCPRTDYDMGFSSKCFYDHSLSKI